MTPLEYAFMAIRDLIPAYKEFLTPIIDDQNLGEEVSISQDRLG